MHGAIVPSQLWRVCCGCQGYNIYTTFTSIIGYSAGMYLHTVTMHTRVRLLSSTGRSSIFLSERYSPGTCSEARYW